MSCNTRTSFGIRILLKQCVSLYPKFLKMMDIYAFIRPIKIDIFYPLISCISSIKTHEFTVNFQIKKYRIAMNAIIIKGKANQMTDLKLAPLTNHIGSINAKVMPRLGRLSKFHKNPALKYNTDDA